MSFKATVIRDTQMLSIRHPPIPLPKGTKLTVYNEASGWGLCDAKVDDEIETGEVLSADYRRD